MRIKLVFDLVGNNNEYMPINNTHILKSYINKCLGDNNKYHGSIGIYSVSNIQGGVISEDKNHLKFVKNNAYFLITSENEEFINDFLNGIADNRDFGYGLVYEDYEHIEEHFYNGWNNFATITPFIIDDKIEGSLNKKRYITLRDDEDFEKKVEVYLLNKLSKINPSFDLSNFQVRIDRTHRSHKTKRVTVRTKKADGVFVDVYNLANQCFISIHCNKDVAKAIYLNGIGKSTNIGFGAIRKTENADRYTVHERF